MGKIRMVLQRSISRHQEAFSVDCLAVTCIPDYETSRGISSLVDEEGSDLASKCLGGNLVDMVKIKHPKGND